MRVPTPPHSKSCMMPPRELLVLIPAGDISRVGAYLDAALQKIRRAGRPDARGARPVAALRAAFRPRAEGVTFPTSQLCAPHAPVRSCKLRSMRSHGAVVKRRAPLTTPPAAAAPSATPPSLKPHSRRSATSLHKNKRNTTPSPSRWNRCKARTPHCKTAFPPRSAAAPASFSPA